MTVLETNYSNGFFKKKYLNCILKGEVYLTNNFS